MVIRNAWKIHFFTDHIKVNGGTFWFLVVVGCIDLGLRNFFEIKMFIKYFTQCRIHLNSY